MPIQRVLAIISGVMTEYVGIDASAGAADAGKLLAANTAGKLDSTLLPAGVGVATASLPATETLAAGAWVNVYNAAGTPSVRNANASTGLTADGFVLAAVASGAAATVYFEGQNTAVTGQTVGRVYLGTTAGAGATAGATAAGHIYQEIGRAYAATAVDFEPQPSILRA